MSTPRLQPDTPVPARYIGPYAVRVAHHIINGDVRDASGTRRNNTKVHRGDVLHLRAHEVYGASYLFDPRGEREPRFLGVGKVVLPEHVALDDAERAALGYEHHEGRADFEPVYALDEATRRFAAAPDAPARAEKRGRGTSAATPPAAETVQTAQAAPDDAAQGA